MPDRIPPNSPLSTLLTRADSRTRREVRSRRTTPWLVGWLIACSGAALVDAFWALPALVRLGYSLAALFALAWILARFFMTALRVRPSQSAIARRIEQRASLAGNPLINAVQLAGGGAMDATSISGMLRNRAIERAGTVAGQVGSEALAASRSVRAWRTSLVALIAIMVMGMLVVPRFARAQWPRFVAPLADHPPFTWLDFKIRTDPEPGRLAVGRPVQIAAELSDAGIGSAVLVVRSKEGGGAVERPMRRGASGDDEQGAHFDVTIPALGQSVSCYVQTARGRSRSVALAPSPVPWFVSRAVVAREPEHYAVLPRLVEDFETPIVLHTGGTLNIRVASSIADCALEISPSSNVGPDTDPDSLGIDRQLVFATPGGFDVEAHLVSSTGQRSDESIRCKVKIVDDAPPAARIDEPERDAVAPVNHAVEIQVSAADDAVLREAQLEIRVRRRGEPRPGDPECTSLIAGLSMGEVKSINVAPVIDIPAMNLEPGDRLVCRVVASDNRPDAQGGPQTTTTDPVEILIVGAEDFDQLAAQQNHHPQGASSESSPGGAGSPSDQSPSRSQADAGGTQGDSNSQDDAAAGEGAMSFKSPDESQSGAGPEQPSAAASKQGSGESPGSAGDSELMNEARDRELLKPPSDERVHAAASSGLSGGQQPDTPPEVQVDAARGAPDIAPDSQRLVRVAPGRSDTGNVSDTRVPPAYRDLVARYFRRLARDEDESRPDSKEQP